MTSEEKMKRWVETWKVAGPELERIKQEELRAMDAATARDLTAQALSLGDSWFAVKRDMDRGSGMAKQQAIFSKMHSRE